MAGNILTPTEIWEGFKSDKDIKTELISESRVGDIIISRVYLGGRKVQGGRVKIYGIIAHNVQMAMLPAIITDTFLLIINLYKIKFSLLQELYS